MLRLEEWQESIYEEEILSIKRLSDSLNNENKKNPYFREQIQIKLKTPQVYKLKSY